MNHYVEIWTTHHDGTVTLVREKVDSDMLAKIRLAFLLVQFKCPCGEPGCEQLENDHGEDVHLDHTCFTKGVVKTGVFQFAAGE